MITNERQLNIKNKDWYFIKNREKSETVLLGLNVLYLITCLNFVYH